MAENSVFLSYRREVGFPWARLVWEALKQRSINVFLDIESMRSAGRFDDRLLKQIAARPYFASILTAGTLERCTDPNDWMRREIEHAIAHDRIIVPIFIAPFDVASFPHDAPEHIAEALATSHGVTVYNQYLEAAMDALAGDLLTPVAIPQAELTEEDQDFEMRAELDLLAQGLRPDGPSRSSSSAPVASDAVGTDAPTGGANANEDGSTEVFAGRPAPPSSVSPEIRSIGGAAAFAGAVPPTDPITSNVVAPDATASQDTSGRARQRAVLLSVIAVGVAVLGVAAVLVLANGDSQPTAVISQSTSTVAEPETSASDTPPPDTASPQQLGRRLDRLELGDHLGANDRMVSSENTHELRMTDDGQLVMSGPDGDAPFAPYEPQPGAVAIFQSTDGNFVVYPSTEQTEREDVIYSFGTANLGGVRLRVNGSEGRGVVEMVAANGTVVHVLEPSPNVDTSAGTDDAPSPSRTESSVPEVTTESSQPTATPEAIEPSEACRAIELASDPPLIDFEGSDRDTRRVVLEPGGSQAFTLNVGFSEQEIQVSLIPLGTEADSLICVVDAAGQQIVARAALQANTGPLGTGKYRVVVVERGEASATYDVQFVIPAL